MRQRSINTYPLGLNLGVLLVITGILTIICGRLYTASGVRVNYGQTGLGKVGSRPTIWRWITLENDLGWARPRLVGAPDYLAWQPWRSP